MQLRVVGFVLLISVLPASGELANGDIDAADSLQGNMTNMNSELVELSSGAEDNIICKDFTAIDPKNGWKITVKRQKTWSNILKVVAKALLVAVAIAALIVGGVYTAGLFKSFMSANTPVELFKVVVQGGRVTSQQSIGMWYSQSAILAYSAKVMLLAGSTGAIGGSLAMTAAAQFNLDFTAMKQSDQITSEMSWLQKFEDVCKMTYFDVTSLRDGSPVEGPWQNFGTTGKGEGVYGLETTSDRGAHDALIKWCTFYGKNSLFGNENTMPLPEQCQKVFDKLKPADYTCGATGETTEIPQGEEMLDEDFTCAAMLEVSRDEMTFQDAYMNAGVMAQMQNNADAPSSCNAEADTSLGFKSSAERLICAADAKQVPFCPGQTEEEFATALAEVEELKAKAVYNCLAVTSCNLLRKNSDKIQGVVRSRKTWGRKTQKHTDMLSMVIKRCLGHHQLLGPQASLICVQGKDCEEDLKEDTDLEMEEHSNTIKDETADEHTHNYAYYHDSDTYSCDADDAAEWSEEKEHCVCVEEAHSKGTESDKKCTCIEPKEATMKEAVLVQKNEAGEDEKACVTRCQNGFVEVQGAKGSACLTPYIITTVQVEYQNLKQGKCSATQLEVTTAAGNKFCLNQYFVEYILNMQESA